MNRQNKRIICILLLITTLLKCNAEGTQDILTAYFLDVGQGDATVIMCGEDIIMIDGGDAKHSSFVYSFLRNKLNVYHIDAVVATHSHSDHIGGLPAVFNACQVDVLYTPEDAYDDSNKEWASVVKYADYQGTPIKMAYPGDEFYFHDLVLTVLGPINEYDDTNEMSLIVKVEYGRISMLFTGDAGMKEENDIIKQGVDVSASILHVSHHGSKTGTSKDFLDAVSPDYGIISVGNNNRYGEKMPSTETINMLNNANVIIKRTDLLGTIVCETDGSSITFIDDAA